MTKFFSLLLLAVFLLPFQAEAACDPDASGCLGEECTSLGETRLDHQKKNIIACLVSEDGLKNVWKSTNSPSSSSSLPDGLIFCGNNDACVDTSVPHTGLCGTGNYAAFGRITWTGTHWDGNSIGARNCPGGVLFFDPLVKK